jgi:hypothetical protein
MCFDCSLIKCTIYLYFQEYLVQFGYMDPRVTRNDSHMTNDNDGKHDENVHYRIPHVCWT